MDRNAKHRQRRAEARSHIIAAMEAAIHACPGLSLAEIAARVGISHASAIVRAHYLGQSIIRAKVNANTHAVAYYPATPSARALDDGERARQALDDVRADPARYARFTRFARSVA